MAEEQIARKGELFLGIDGFLRLLEDMERQGEEKRIVFGAVEGPFFSKAVYSCVIRIGIGD